MRTLGIRQTKAHLSALVRAAAKGECSIVTDNGKSVAMIGPPPLEPIEPPDPPPQPEKTPTLSDAAAFRKALFSAPYPLELGF